MIWQFIHTDHRRWDEHLPSLQFAYNSAQQSSTGYAPAYLNYGREMRPPHSRARTEDGAPCDPSRQARKLREAYELVRIHLARAFQRQQRHYDLRRHKWRPQLGEVVWKREHPLSSRGRAFSAKLAPRYTGPFTIQRIASPVIVDLRDTDGRVYKHVHVRDLKNQGEKQITDASAPTNKLPKNKDSRGKKKKGRRNTASFATVTPDISAQQRGRGNSESLTSKGAKDGGRKRDSTEVPRHGAVARNAHTAVRSPTGTEMGLVVGRGTAKARLS